MTDPNKLLPPREVLKLSLASRAARDSGATTIRGYLVAVVEAMWDDGGSGNVDSKRPFGSSGWHVDLYETLIVHEQIDGVLDEDGYMESCDSRAGERTIRDAIRWLGAVDTPPARPAETAPDGDRIDQVIALGQAAAPAADGSLTRQLTAALTWARHALHQADTDLAVALAAMRQGCECADKDTPPTDWGNGAPIPHHCDCPMYPLERPDPDTAPTAAADAAAKYQQLKTDLTGPASRPPEVPPT